MPSDKNQKETFSESALGHVKSPHTVNLLFLLSSILTLFWVSQQRNTRERFEAYGERANIFQ